MIDSLLLIAASLFICALTLIEGFAIVTRQPTISGRIQGWAQRNVQLAVLVGVITGWLIAHFTGWPG